MDPVALTAAILSLIASSVAIVVAFRAAEKASQANRRSEVVASGAAANVFASQPTRDERIEWARGHIEACKGAELALELHREELPAALLLAQYRAHAARAKHELRALGIES